MTRPSWHTNASKRVVIASPFGQVAATVATPRRLALPSKAMTERNEAKNLFPRRECYVIKLWRGSPSPIP